MDLTQQRAEERKAVLNLEHMAVAFGLPPLTAPVPVEVPKMVAPAPAAPTTREAWLAGAVALLRPVLADKGYVLPTAIRVSCGFPGTKALARKARRVGECWYPDMALDGAVNIFVSPLVADTAEVLGILVHELGHAALGRKVAHKGKFVAFCKVTYLEGKPTATTVGDTFKRLMLPLVGSLGEYPHAALVPVTNERKQGTRMLKVSCGTCGYTCRVTAKWLQIGAPVCPEDAIPMTAPDTGE